MVGNNGFIGLVDLVPFYHLWFAPFSAIPVDKEASLDGQEPGSAVCAWLKLVEETKSPQKRFLNQIFSFGLISGQVISRCVELREMAKGNLFEFRP